MGFVQPGSSPRISIVKTNTKMIKWMNVTNAKTIKWMNVTNVKTTKWMNKMNIKMIMKTSIKT